MVNVLVQCHLIRFVPTDVRMRERNRLAQRLHPVQEANMLARVLNYIQRYRPVVLHYRIAIWDNTNDQPFPLGKPADEL